MIRRILLKISWDVQAAYPLTMLQDAMPRAANSMHDVLLTPLHGIQSTIIFRRLTRLNIPAGLETDTGAI